MITTSTIEDLVDRLELAVGKCREAGVDLGRFWEQKTDELIYLTRRDISAKDYSIDGLCKTYASAMHDDDDDDIDW